MEARAPISVRRLAEVLSVRATCALRLAYEELGLGRVHLYTELDAETAARIARALDVELRVVE